MEFRGDRLRSALAAGTGVLALLSASIGHAHDFAWSRFDLKLEPAGVIVEAYLDPESLADATQAKLPIRELDEIPDVRPLQAYFLEHFRVWRGETECPLDAIRTEIDRRLGKIHVSARGDCPSTTGVKIRSSLFFDEGDAHQLIGSLSAGSRHGRYLFDGAVGELSIAVSDLPDLAGGKPMAPVIPLALAGAIAEPDAGSRPARTEGMETEDAVLIRIGKGPNALRLREGMLPWALLAFACAIALIVIVRRVGSRWTASRR